MQTLLDSSNQARKPSPAAGQLRRGAPELFDNIGLSPETFNYAFGEGATIGSADGEVLIALNEKHHGPTEKYTKQLRSRLNVRQKRYQ